jgi:hypothetical protein
VASVLQRTGLVAAAEVLVAELALADDFQSVGWITLCIVFVFLYDSLILLM